MKESRFLRRPTETEIQESPITSARTKFESAHSLVKGMRRQLNDNRGVLLPVGEHIGITSMANVPLTREEQDAIKRALQPLPPDVQEYTSRQNALNDSNTFYGPDYPVRDPAYPHNRVEPTPNGLNQPLKHVRTHTSSR